MDISLKLLLNSLKTKYIIGNFNEVSSEDKPKDRLPKIPLYSFERAYCYFFN